MNLTAKARKFAFGRLFLCGAMLIAAGAPLCPTTVLAGDAAAGDKADAQAGSNEWSQRAWRIAKSGRFDDFVAYIHTLPEDPTIGAEQRAEMERSVKLLDENLAKRDQKRIERIGEVNKELDERLQGEMTPQRLAKAMRSALELWVLSTDKPSVLEDARVKKLIADADAAARKSEQDGDWLVSSEMFSLLNALLEESGQYKPDLERQSRRLTMIRMYTPQRLWEMRNERLKAEGDKPLPPYNATGDDFHEKLKGIDQDMVVRAIARATDHVEQVPTRRLLIGGIIAVETMIATNDLHRAFPDLDNQIAKEAMLTALRTEREQLGTPKKNAFGRVSEPGVGEIDALLNRVLAVNDRTVKISREALLHEFGNGAIDQLDEFSAIIWPDELNRFNRTTQGKFVGVGVQIELDDQSNVRVVTPLEGTPAFRAGIRAGDIIKKINGKSAYGMSIDQVVDHITGPDGTQVVLSIDRPENDGAQTADALVGDTGQPPAVEAGKGEGAAKPDKKFKEMEVAINRQLINVVSVKGWKRKGTREDAWDWFIDPQNRIGYVRLTQFSEKTAEELRRAVGQMQKDGLNGLVLDLRFNPGGYLDQAVQVANLFVDNGVVVAMQGPNGRAESPEMAKSNVARLKNTPVVVLINEGSASASEIVSGTLQHYGRTGDVNVMILGQRSYGKGSVQKVFGLSDDAAMKLTMQYYAIPDTAMPGYRIIHRKPGAHEWGITPNLAVEMLPKQTTESILLRRNADVLPTEGDSPNKAALPDPDKLLTDGLDLQLETAVQILRAAAYGQRPGSNTQVLKDR
ncbi:MAG: S41 family peptidase [Planctomycetes bacterium]|nr:S41 family peptidase [Planctomycetota bacterium]